MDQYLSQIAPTIMKQLMEQNTLRSSGQLQKEQEKTGKVEKTRRAGGVPDGGIDAGSMAMSDDLFDTSTGSLNYEGFGNARSWRELQEERRHRAGGQAPRGADDSPEPSPPPVDTTASPSSDLPARTDLSQAVNAPREELPQAPPLFSIPAFEEEPLPAFEPKRLEDLILSHHSLLKEKLARILAIVGERTLVRCREFGIRILLVPEGISLASLGFGGLPAELEGIRAAYLPRHKICLLGEEHVREWSPAGFNLPLYLLAHGFDHALGNDSFASGKSPAVLASFTACRLGTDRHAFLDSYSTLSPVHYFATAVTAFFTRPDHLSDGARPSLPAESSPDATQDVRAGRFTRRDLAACDPTLFQYLSHLFAQEPSLP